MVEGIEISKSKEVEFYNKYDEKISIVPNLKKVNIFIGENNCGKSRLMRSFTKEQLEVYSQDNIKNHQNNFNQSMENLKQHIKNLKNSNKIKSINNILLEHTDTEIFYDLIELMPQLNKEKIQLNKNDFKERNIISKIESIESNLENLKSYQKATGNSSLYINQKNIIYIPILRGIENFEIYFKSSDILNGIKMTQREYGALNEYKNNAKKVYMNKIADSYKIPENKIFTAESLYDDITNKLLGDEESRNFVKEFEKFIVQNFYNDDIEFTVTPNKKKKYLGIKIGTNPDRALYNLGEGIKQLIILFYKMIELKDKETIFLIEEPELNLHPGFQRKFIEIITNEFPKHQFFITTHSNHIVDLYNEQENISLYKFKNANKGKDKFYIERVLPKDVSILDEIGAKNSSMFMSNCTIWVEGISDKIYISKYLELYFKENGIDRYKEDIHYSFIEYGGNNITHWSFIDDENIEKINVSSITNNVFLICDNDNGKKEERKKKLKEILGENLYILKSREIENLISKSILEDMLKEDNNIKEIEYKRYKKSGFNEEKYAKPDIKMADFIDKTYVLTKTYSDKYKALKNKASFAKKIVNKLSSYNDLSNEAKELTEKIVEFINSNNG